jgi:hypothetical protein
MRPEQAWSSRVALCVIGLTTAACDESKPSLPDWRDGYEQSRTQWNGDAGLDGDGGAGTDAKDFRLSVSRGVGHPYRLYRKGTSEACAVALGASGQDADIECLLDINELDLFVLGLTLDIAGPAGMCDFVDLQHYLYENFEVGEGPAEVSYSRDAQGNIVDEVNSVDGVPSCAFDYSQQSDSLPNCCLGSYTKTVTDLPTGKTSTSDGWWGGEEKLGDCFDGSGFRFKDVGLSVDGFPMGRIYYFNHAAFREPLTYEGLSELYPRDNRPLANYYDSTDHGGPPFALRSPWATTAYTVRCLDDAEEVIARIRLWVREWNEEVQFNLAANGDPDTVGSEPFWSTPLNDLTDWGDFVGNPDDYPRHPRIEN